MATGDVQGAIQSPEDTRSEDQGSTDSHQTEATQSTIEKLERRLDSLEKLLQEERERGRQRDELMATLLARLQDGTFAKPRTEGPVAKTTSPITQPEVQAHRQTSLALYPWQLEALDWWQKNSHRGVVEAVTGAGKTRLAVAAIEQQQRRGEPAVVVVRG